MATFKFLIQSDSPTAGIYIRVRDGRTIDVKAKTNFIINSKDWDSAKGLPTAKALKSAENKNLLANLSLFRSRLLQHYNQTAKAEVSSKWLKDFINPPIEEKGISSYLTEHFDLYVSHKKHLLSVNSKKRFKVVKHLLERYEKHTGMRITVNSVNLDFQSKLEEYCLTENYSVNTITKTIKQVKSVCRHARRLGISAHAELDEIKVKYQKVEKIFLSSEELIIIENTELTDKLDEARDWLIISCETGQRVSDFLKFNKDMIRYQGQTPLIEFTQVKTKKIMTVPLSKRVIKILNKRSGEFPPTMADQTYNECLKLLCKAAGLNQKIKGGIKDKKTQRKKSGTYEKWQLVSSHIGRRSFATNNYGYIPTSLLMGATGHSTERQFLEYIGKSDNQKALQLADYFK